MNDATLCMHEDEVERLLGGEMNSVRTAELEQHLATCNECRQRLEQQVGDNSWWCETESSLRSRHVAASFRDTEARFDENLNAEAASLGETRLRESILDLLGPTDDPHMLGRIGPYEIIGLLGQGGMGAVFKGFDRSLNRFVAIKILLPHLAASGAARKRFAREGQAVAAVVDDHVMAIHCVDEWQGIPYLVMTYSRGVSLQKRLNDNGPLEVLEILRIGMQAAKGLAAAHAQGIVHRDIKPANIFLDQTVERVQLMDFGLARAVDDASLTRSGTLAGTPQYMSPEQARAETVDHRSDLFSLGSVMYAMCTGHPPFRAESSYSVLRLITDKEPRPICELNPEVPTWLCAIISKLMSKQADDRFESAEQIAELLKKCLAHLQSPLTSTLPVELRSLPGGQDFCRSKAKLGRSLALPHEDWRGIFQAATRLKVVFAMCCLSFVAVLLFNQYAAPPQSKNDSAVALESGAQNANVPASEPVAVVMVMHPAELRKGNTIQRAAATKTLGLLSDNDYCGILRYGYSKSEANWLWGDGTELQKVGANRKEWFAAIAESKTGDFPAFAPAFKMALDALTKLNASQKMMLVFTDGTPILVDETLIEQFRTARIRVSVIHVDIHRIKERALLKRLSEATGGTYHYALESQAAVVETLFVREVQALRADNKATLQKIGLAFHMIHDKIGRFPGSRMKHLDRQDKEFGHPFSWRLAILPYIGQQQLFDEYRFDEPWDSDKNILLLKKMPDIYRSPHASADQPLGNSNMQGFATENGGLGLNAGEAMSSFTDGMSNTILIVETAQSVPWTQPVDLTERTVQPIAAQPLRFVLADGSVGEMNPIDASRLEKMITRNGGEIVENVPSNKPDDLETGREAKRHADKQDAVIANLQALLKLQMLREESVRQLSLTGSIRQFQKIETQRNEGESNEDFIARYTSLPAKFDQLGPFPMSVLRDYTKDLGHIKYGDINVPFPMYREWFFRGDMFTELMGSGQGRCQAKITKHPAEELKQPWSGWLRADVFAMRPIRDHLMSLTLEKAAFTPGLPDLGGRPLFELKKQDTADKRASWIATFLHQEPTVKDGRKAAEQLWFRVQWEQLENELIIKRIDELSVVGNADSMPRTVTLLEDYRKTEGVSLPHRTRVFMFGISGILGAQFDATEIKVNDGVVVPTELSIPEGTSVRDEVNNKKYRQPAVDKP